MINYLPPLPPEQTITIKGIPITLYVVEDGGWLLKDEQVAKAYGIKSDTVRRHCNRNRNVLIEGVHWFKKRGVLPAYYPHLRLWTKEGFIKLGNYVKTSEAETLLDALGVKSRQRTKVESEYINVIKDTFKGILPLESQFELAGYKIDIYFPTLRLAVEIDEYNHKSYNDFLEILRETTIKNRSNCDMIRFNPNAPDNNVGKLINAILIKYVARKEEGISHALQK